jgi:hypothetical protein
VIPDRLAIWEADHGVYAAAEQQVFRWINGRDPRQYGLDFGLWRRA